jgi:hypothetical protein
MPSRVWKEVSCRGRAERGACQLFFFPSPSSSQLNPHPEHFPPPDPWLRAWLPSLSPPAKGQGRGFLPRHGLLRPRPQPHGPGSPEAVVAAAAAGAESPPPGCQSSRARSDRCPCSRLPAGYGALQAVLTRSPAPSPRARLGNLRRSLAPGPGEGGVARDGPLAAGPCRSRLGPLGKFPSRQGRSGGAEPASGRGGRPELPAAESCSLGAQRPAGLPGAAQVPSLCLAQRSGRPVPRRPLRAPLPLSMPRAGRCPERTPLAKGLLAPNRARVPRQS